MTWLFGYLCDLSYDGLCIVSFHSCQHLFTGAAVDARQQSIHQLKYRETRFDENMNSMKMTLALKR